VLFSYASGSHLQLYLCIKWLAFVVSRMALFWLVNGLYPTHRITWASSSCGWIILDDFHCIVMEVSQYSKWKRSMVWTFTYTISFQFRITSGTRKQTWGQVCQYGSSMCWICMVRCGFWQWTSVIFRFHTDKEFIDCINIIYLRRSMMYDRDYQL
jgi:hypothetical protein